MTDLGRISLAKAAFLGSLTYPLYLLHAHIGYMVMATYGTEANKFLLAVGLMALMLAASALVAEFIERRPKRFWRRAAQLPFSILGFPPYRERSKASSELGKDT